MENGNNLIIDIITNISTMQVLDEGVIGRLEFQCTGFIWNAVNIKVVRLDNKINFYTFLQTNKDNNKPETTLTLGNLKLKVEYIAGGEVEKDSYFDSTYILTAMVQVRMLMRENMHR